MSLFGNKKELKSKLVITLKLEDNQRTIRYALIRNGAHVNDIQFKTVDSFEEIAELKKKTPVVFHVFGFGVLTRQVENVPNYKESLIVSGDKDDFYFASYEFKQSICVSFVRKVLLEEYFDYFKEQKAFLFELTLGPIPLLFLRDKYSKIDSDYSITFNERELKTIERNDDSLHNNQRTKYSEAFTYFENLEDENYIQGLPYEQYLEVNKEYNEYKRFVSLGIGILVFFLVALTSNYFYVNHLNQKSAELESEIYSFGENLSLIDRLNQEKLRKVSLVENSGIQTENYLSYYIDEIAATSPLTINFETMEVFPLIEPLKPKRKVELDLKQISLKGQSSSSKTLDDWMELLERKEWVRGVELINYLRIDSGKANFHLVIKLAS
jgi:Tfp pilus assembly protein PilN